MRNAVVYSGDVLTDPVGEGSPAEHAVPQSSGGAAGGGGGQLAVGRRRVRRRPAQVPLHLGQTERLARRRRQRLQVLVAGPLLQPRLVDTRGQHTGSGTQHRVRLRVTATGSSSRTWQLRHEAGYEQNQRMHVAT